MSAQAESPLYISARKILAYLRRPGWRSANSNRTTPKRRLFGRLRIPRFDADEESLFWQERNAEMLKPLKGALLLGALGFFAFVMLDFFARDLSVWQVMGRGLIVLALGGLFGWLNRAGPSRFVAIAPVANCAAAISALNLIGTLLIEANPGFYAESWPGLLPIYFVTYGQLVMPIAATLVFGWLTLIAMPVTGYLIGVEANALAPSCLMLLIVNLFGMYTRCQLEAYSRNSFQARRRAEAAAEEKAEFMRQASHNLRQPLQALSCYSSVLDDALARDRIDEVRRTAGKLGVAIDELNDSLFKEFHRCHRRQNDPHPHGLGIGLAYAMKAIERLPGHCLQARSKPGRGTDFQIILPVTLPTLGPRSQAPVQTDLAGSYVLLVDDDAEVLNALAEQMQRWGCLVDKAGSLAEVRQLLAETLRPPDLLITDFYLDQDETAHDIIAAVEADCGPVPTVILSARAIPEADKMRWPQSVLLLRKPASAATLLETMGKALEKSTSL